MSNSFFKKKRPSRSETSTKKIFFIKKKTVKNGGTLTHTDDDFRKANYLFCDGMDDPWLNKYVVEEFHVRCCPNR